MDKKLLNTLKALHKLMFHCVPKDHIYCYLPYYVIHGRKGEVENIKMFHPVEDIEIDVRLWKDFAEQNPQMVKDALERGRPQGEEENEAELYRMVKNIEANVDAHPGIHIDKDWAGSKQYGSVLEGPDGRKKETEYAEVNKDLFPVAMYVLDTHMRVVLIASITYFRGVQDDYRWQPALAILNRILSTLKIWELVDSHGDNIEALLSETKMQPIFVDDTIHDPLLFKKARKEDGSAASELIDVVTNHWFPSEDDKRDSLVNLLIKGDECAFNIVKAMFCRGHRESDGNFHPIALLAAIWLAIPYEVAVSLSWLTESGKVIEKTTPCLDLSFLKTVQESFHDELHEPTYTTVARVKPIRFYGHIAGFCRTLEPSEIPVRFSLESVHIMYHKESVDVVLNGRGTQRIDVNPFNWFSDPNRHPKRNFKSHLDNLVRLCHYSAGETCVAPFAISKNATDDSLSCSASVIVAYEEEISLEVKASSDEADSLDGEAFQIRDVHGLISAELILDRPNFYGIWTTEDAERSQVSPYHAKSFGGGTTAVELMRQRVATLMDDLNSQESMLKSVSLSRRLKRFQDIRSQHLLRLLRTERIALLCIHHQSNSVLCREDIPSVRAKKRIPTDLLVRGCPEETAYALEDYCDIAKDRMLLRLAALLRAVDATDINRARVGDANEADAKKAGLDRDLSYQFSLLKQSVDVMADQAAMQGGLRRRFVELFYEQVVENIRREQGVSIKAKDAQQLFLTTNAPQLRLDVYDLLVDFIEFICVQEGHFDLHSSLDRTEIVRKTNDPRKFTLRYHSNKETSWLRSRKIRQKGDTSDLSLVERLLGSRKLKTPSYVLKDFREKDLDYWFDTNVRIELRDRMGDPLEDDMDA